MRTRQEIFVAVNLLDLYGGKHKRSQIGVLKDRMTESQVFDLYVTNYSGDKRNEALYFAVRDAAQYVSGKLTLEELIPDTPDGAAENLMCEFKECEAEEAVVITMKDFRTLVHRIDEMEAQVKALMQPKDEINQSQARKYIGCSDVLLRRWTQSGKVHATHGTGKQLVYRISELSRNETVQEYWKKYKKQL